jgi:hypothetical protein
VGSFEGFYQIFHGLFAAVNPSRKVTQLGREREGEREGGEVRGSREHVAEKRVVQEEKEFELVTEKRREEVVDKVRCVVYRK